jgi:hypothetical protein
MSLQRRILIPRFDHSTVKAATSMNAPATSISADTSPIIHTDYEAISGQTIPRKSAHPPADSRCIESPRAAEMQLRAPHAFLKRMALAQRATFRVAVTAERPSTSRRSCGASLSALLSSMSLLPRTLIFSFVFYLAPAAHLFFLYLASSPTQKGAR